MRHAAATVRLTGEGGRRAAFNLIGRLDRGKAKWVVVSTPRSGWTDCAGERGGGIAAWLDLARGIPALLPDHNLAFLCNSGHEYENLGAEEALKAVAPKPDATHFWLHLGANLAARDWHEGLFGLAPLAGTDSQRYLVVSPRCLRPRGACSRALPDLKALTPATNCRPANSPRSSPQATHRSQAFSASIVSIMSKATMRAASMRVRSRRRPPPSGSCSLPRPRRAGVGF